MIRGSVGGRKSRQHSSDQFHLCTVRMFFLVCAVILVSSKCVQCRFDSLCWSNQHSVALMLLVGQQEGHPVCKN